MEFIDNYDNRLLKKSRNRISPEIKWRIVNALKTKNYNEVSEMFDLSPKTIQTIYRIHKKSQGNITLRRDEVPRSYCNSHQQAFLNKLLDIDCTLSLRTLQRVYFTRYAQSLSLPTIARYVDDFKYNIKFSVAIEKYKGQQESIHPKLSHIFDPYSSLEITHDKLIIFNLVNIIVNTRVKCKYINQKTNNQESDVCYERKEYKLLIGVCEEKVLSATLRENIGFNGEEILNIIQDCARIYFPNNARDKIIVIGPGIPWVRKYLNDLYSITYANAGGYMKKNYGNIDFRLSISNHLNQDDFFAIDGYYNTVYFMKPVIHLANKIVKSVTDKSHSCLRSISATISKNTMLLAGVKTGKYFKKMDGFIENLSYGIKLRESEHKSDSSPKITQKKKLQIKNEMIDYYLKKKNYLFTKDKGHFIDFCKLRSSDVSSSSGDDFEVSNESSFQINEECEHLFANKTVVLTRKLSTDYDTTEMQNDSIIFRKFKYTSETDNSNSSVSISVDEVSSPLTKNTPDNQILKQCCNITINFFKSEQTCSSPSIPIVDGKYIQCSGCNTNIPIDIVHTADESLTKSVVGDHFYDGSFTINDFFNNLKQNYLIQTQAIDDIIKKSKFKLENKTEDNPLANIQRTWICEARRRLAIQKPNIPAALFRLYLESSEKSLDMILHILENKLVNSLLVEPPKNGIQVITVYGCDRTHVRAFSWRLDDNDKNFYIQDDRKFATVEIRVNKSYNKINTKTLDISPPKTPPRKKSSKRTKSYDFFTQLKTICLSPVDLNYEEHYNIILEDIMKQKESNHYEVIPQIAERNNQRINIILSELHTQKGNVKEDMLTNIQRLLNENSMLINHYYFSKITHDCCSFNNVTTSINSNTNDITKSTEGATLDYLIDAFNLNDTKPETKDKENDENKANKKHNEVADDEMTFGNFLDFVEGLGAEISAVVFDPFGKGVLRKVMPSITPS